MTAPAPKGSKKAGSGSGSATLIKCGSALDLEYGLILFLFWEPLPNVMRTSFFRIPLPIRIFLLSLIMTIPICIPQVTVSTFLLKNPILCHMHAQLFQYLPIYTIPSQVPGTVTIPVSHSPDSFVLRIAFQYLGIYLSIQSRPRFRVPLSSRYPVFLSRQYRTTPWILSVYLYFSFVLHHKYTTHPSNPILTDSDYIAKLQSKRIKSPV